MPGHAPPANIDISNNMAAQHDTASGAADMAGQNVSIDLPIALHNGARISKKTYLAARTGEFVHLPEFAPNTEPSTIMESVLDETTGQLV